MIEFIAGVIVGAVFAPFWMKLWKGAKERLGFGNE